MWAGVIAGIVAAGICFKTATNPFSAQILKPGEQPVRVYAGSLLGYGAIPQLRMTAVAVAEWLGNRQPEVTRAANRGESITASNNLKLVEK